MPTPNTRRPRKPSSSGRCNPGTQSTCKSFWAPAAWPPWSIAARRIWPAIPGGRCMTSRLRMASRRWLRAWRPRRRRSSRSCSSRCSRSCRAAWRRRRRWTMPSVWSWRACCASKPVPAPRARPIYPMRPMRTHAAPTPVAAMPARPGRDWTPSWFAAPVALYLLLFQGYPLVQELYLSFTSTALLTPDQHVFVGLQNFIDLVTQEDFRQVLLITAIYTVVCVVAAIALGLGAALLLDAPFRGRGLARALVTIPWAAPPVAVALILVWIYNRQYRIFNHLPAAPPPSPP